jgi:regulator of RNase E activity RraA
LIDGLGRPSYTENISMNESPREITLAMMRESLYAAVVSDALDSLGYRQQSPNIVLTPYSGSGLLVGRAKTTQWEEMHELDPQPYELELQAIDECRPDDVFIAAAQGSTHSGVWGELLSTAARNAGCVGAIIDGGVRDVAKIREMNFQVFARSTRVYDSLHRQRVVAIDEPVDIGGVEIHHGDLVFADLDGIVVVPQEIEQEAIASAWQKVHDENEVRDSIRGGMKATAAFKKYGVL